MNRNKTYEQLKTLCSSRRSVRSFDNTSITEEQITAIHNIAKTAPYASGKKNWELLTVTDREVIGELAGIVRNCCREMASKVRSDFREQFVEYARNFTAFASAPALLVPVFKVQRSLSLMVAAPDDQLLQWERDNYVKSIAGVTMLVLLAAESMGLGSCCMTGPLLANAEIVRRIGVKQGFEIGAIIPVGWTNEEHRG
jgi:nitroreductase